VIDPLGHCENGFVYFPDDLIGGRALLPILLSYNLFAGYGADPENVSEITVYVMGADAHFYPDAPGNYWSTFTNWPSHKPTNWYFYSNGKLSSAPPTSSTGSQSYVYDPRNPVPSMGGNNLFIACGPLDQRPVEQNNRTDVLTFTSDALSAPVALLGPIVATLYVSSDQVDTDFTVKLTDVYPFPNDNSRLIQDGMIRMRWRDYEPAKNITPGQVYEVNVTLWNTCYVYDQGHKIRVSISSSNYPRYSASPNNGWTLNSTVASAGPLNKATNTFYHNSKYASKISLPVVSLTDLPKIQIYESWQKQLEDRIGVDAVAKIMNSPSIIDRHLNPEWSQIRQQNTPAWWSEYDSHLKVQ